MSIAPAANSIFSFLKGLFNQLPPGPGPCGDWLIVTPGDIITPLPPDGAAPVGESTISASPAPEASVPEASVSELPDEEDEDDE